jgi:hypothetical protein
MIVRGVCGRRKGLWADPVENRPRESCFRGNDASFLQVVNASFLQVVIPAKARESGDPEGFVSGVLSIGGGMARGWNMAAR